MTQIEDLEDQLKQAEEAIELWQKALKLEKNREFKAVILDKFMVEDCAMYARTSVDQALPPEKRAHALAIAQAAGLLKQYLSVICQLGSQANGQIEHIRQAIAEARSEDI